MANDDKPAWQGNQGSRHARGYGRDWDKRRIRILQRDYYLCQQCKREGRVTPLGVKPRDHAVDHIKPKAKGGDDSDTNLQSLCAPCHDAKSLREAQEGRGCKPRPQFDAQGFPVWNE